MTFEEWFEHNGSNTPFDDKELGAAWELIKFFWEAGYDQGVEGCGYFPEEFAPELAGDGSNYDH